MRIALITAGGLGTRMSNSVPKQFIRVQGKPVIVYTLEVFNRHNQIDAIAVVCLNGWEKELQKYAIEFQIAKLKWIFPGGSTNHESIYNGIKGLKDVGCADDDIVLVHDGVRPYISEDIITENIKVCSEHGYAVTGLVCKEVIMFKNSETVSPIEYKREQLVATQTPHTYHLRTLADAFETAQQNGIVSSVAPCELFSLLGVLEQHLVLGTEKNALKVTRPQDLEILRALLEIDQLKQS